MKAPRWQKFVFPAVLAVLVVLTYLPVFTTTRLPGGDLSDTVHQGYPFMSFVENCIKEGYLPHWNPYVFCGVPFYSSFSAPVFYPVRGLLLLSAGTEAMARFMFPIHMLLGGLFAWLFLGSLGVSRTGRFIGALAYASGGWANTLFYAGHGSKIICWSYLPLLLYGCEQWMKTRRPVFLGLGGLAMGMQGLASHPQMVLYSGGAAFLWFLVRSFELGKKKFGRAAIGLFCIALLGISIGAIQLLPGYGFSKYSSRGANLSLDQAASYSLPPEESLTMVFPHMYGLRHGFPDSSLSGVPVYFGRLGLRLSSEFLGVSVFLLALIGFLLAEGKIRWPLLVIALSGLIVSWGGYTPIFRILYAVIPVFRKLRAPHMAAFLTTSSFALMAGPGFDALFRTTSAFRKKMLLITCFSGVCLLLFLVAAPLSKSLQSGWWAGVGAPGGTGFQQVVEQRISMFSGDLARATGVGIVFLILIYLGRKYSMKLPVTAGILAVLLALELVPFNRNFQVYLPQSSIEDIYPDQSSLRDLAGHGRVMPGGNDLVQSSIRSVNGYHAAKPEITDQLLTVLAQADLTVARQTAVSVFAFDGSVSTYGEIRSSILEQIAASDPVMADSLDREVPTDPLPRAFFAGSWSVIDENRIVDALNLGYNPEEITLLEENPVGLLEGSPEPHGSVVITQDDCNSVVIETQNDQNGLLVLADTWYPKWRAFVDGEETEILKANFWQRAVVVPAGNHSVEFRFDSSDVRTGLRISIAGLLLVCALGVMDLRKRYRKT